METTLKFGSIISGTLRTEDLWDAFLSEVRSRGIDNTDTEEMRRVDDGLSIVDDEATWDAFYESDYAVEAVNETLPDMLNDGLPSFVYFGSHPGDGADFGYWFDLDGFNDSVSDGECIKVETLPDVWPDDETVTLCAVVSDHGNIELYARGADGGFIHLYGVV